MMEFLYGINKLSKIRASVATAILFLFTSGTASAITYTYSGVGNSCKTLTLAPTGAITCNTEGTNATPFHFDSLPLSCKAGLDINTSTGLVKCATTLPTCTLLRATASGTAVLKPGEAVKAKPGETVTLTATCDQEAAHYYWSSTQTSTSEVSPSPIPESNPITAKVIIPDTASAGYHSYTVMASKRADFGYGVSASTIVKVDVSGQSGPYAYISEASGSVSVIDTASNTLTANPIVGVGSAPVGVAVHPSGIRAYVTSSALNSVSVIDTASNKILDSVSVAPDGTGPTGVAITPDGKKIYVANKTSNNVSVIETTNLEATPKILPVGTSPASVAISPDGKKVYVANSGSNNVSVINVDGDTDGGTIITDAGPFGVAVTTDGKKIFVSNSIDNTVTEIKVSDTGGYPSAGFPLGEGAKTPRGIAVKPDDTEVYVANQDSSTISVISTADNKNIATLTGINSPYGVAFNQTGSLAYVTNTNDKTVSIIDTLTKEVVDKISVDGNPYALGQFVGPASPYRGLWYNKQESGWGMGIIQHGNINFVTIFTYDQAGQPVWYVMSNCPFVTARSCTGDIYKVVGGKPPHAAWVALDLDRAVSVAGSGTLTFSDINNGKLDFTLNNVPGSKTIERQRFHSGTTAGALDYTDLWWNADESGWGVALTQDKGMIFAAWYTYNDSGNPVWYVVSECRLSGSSCTGELYSVTGGTELAAKWNASPVATTVGSVKFAFSSDGSTGTMSYNISGVQKSKDITRQPFPFDNQ